MTDLQLAAAAGLGLPLFLLIAAQGFDAATGNSAALHNVIIGAGMFGLREPEGDILRKTGPVCLACLLGGGILVLTVASGFP